jgi:hypothetical protein
MVELEGMRYEVGTIDRYKVCCAINCVNVNDTEVWGAILENTWLNDPHASVFIGTVTDLVEPLDKNTGIYFPPEFERKETLDPRNVEPSHPFEVRISVDEYTIITGIDISPEWTSTDLLTSHATNTTRITWRIECRGSRIKDLELAFMSRALSSGNIFRVARIIREQLSEQEVSDEAS